jgi:rRNA maturation RNase YbeY
MISFNHLSQLPKQIDTNSYRSLIKRTLALEEKRLGDISYIFCDDAYLLDINQKYLDHDTLTDIITFPLSNKEDIVSGEIYISVERVRENAKELQVPFPQELKRVIVHGVLHLCGYDDATHEQKKAMRAKEDYYIHLHPHS